MDADSERPYQLFFKNHQLQPETKILFTTLHFTFYCNCSCADWFHPKCCGLTQHQVRNADKFLCPGCRGVSGTDESLDPRMILRIRKTKGPSKVALVESLADLKQLPVVVEEEGLLEQVVKARCGLCSHVLVVSVSSLYALHSRYRVVIPIVANALRFCVDCIILAARNPSPFLIFSHRTAPNGRRASSSCSRTRAAASAPTPRAPGPPWTPRWTRPGACTS